MKIEASSPDSDPGAAGGSGQEGSRHPERVGSPEAQRVLQAIREYQTRHGRVFPTWSEVLEVLRSLGHESSR